MVRQVDKRETARVRDAHEAGVERLNRLFLVHPAKIPFNPMNGHAVGGTKVERVRWRQWRDSTFAPRALRRKRRKIARASARKNRP